MPTVDSLKILSARLQLDEETQRAWMADWDLYRQRARLREALWDGFLRERGRLIQSLLTRPVRAPWTEEEVGQEVAVLTGTATAQSGDDDDSEMLLEEFLMPFERHIYWAVSAAFLGDFTTAQRELLAGWMDPDSHATISGAWTQMDRERAAVAEAKVEELLNHRSRRHDARDYWSQVRQQRGVVLQGGKRSPRVDD